MKRTNAASYGIASAAYLASANGEVVSNTTICNAYRMPGRFVIQIMRLLVSAGIVNSTCGRDGGYKLAKPASKITLLEIIEAVDGPLVVGFDGNLAFAPKANAAIHGAFAAIEADARKRLGAITLADLRAAKAA